MADLEQWIDLAKGPLFAFSFLVMTLGLMRLVLVQVYSLILRKGRRLRNVPWNKIAVEAASWAVPVKHLIPGTRLFSITSYLFHVGVILVPLFLADHVVLWEAFLGINLPAIGMALADVLTIFTMICIVVLFACRMFIPRLRSMSTFTDYALLGLILVPFVTGFLAAHPGYNPFSWQSVILFHILSSELLFICVPFSKLSHVVLFFFERISQLHWQLRPGAGDKVAETLFGKEARV